MSKCCSIIKDGTWLRENINVSLAYEFMWFGDLDLYLNDGLLTGRVSGEYEEVRMHFINVGLNWRF